MGQHGNRFGYASHLHQPAWALWSRYDDRGEGDCRKQSHQEHPSPANGGIPGVVSHALDLHVYEHSREYAEDYPHLVERDQPPAQAGGRNLCDIHGSYDRSGADADAPDDAPDNELIEAGREPDAGRRQRKTGRTYGEPLLLPEVIHEGARAHSSGDASDEGAAGRPANAGGIEVE